MSFLVAERSVAEIFKDTVYLERAWTCVHYFLFRDTDALTYGRFQEFQLTHRLLVLVPNGQVYFACEEASYCEDDPACLG